MKEQFRLIPIFLLAGSLLVLLVLFVIRVNGDNNQISGAKLPQTAAVVKATAEMVPTSTATKTPLPSKTPTPEPTATMPTTTVTETLTDLAILETGSPLGCNEVAFLADVTIPDNTTLDPGQKFTKTWRLQNNGTCTWDTDYTIYFHSGEKMSGPSSQKMVTIPVPPGKTIEISIDLTAPKEPGKYKGYWAFKNAGGHHFGLTENRYPIYVLIKVVGP
ncbi:MAG: NBR1-Ig-like domain-containing protein [Anaerolineales bacterium]